MKTKYKVKVTEAFDDVSKYNVVIKQEVSNWPVTYTLKNKRNDYSIYPEFRGKKVISFTDTGNEIIIQKVGGGVVELNYAEFQELFILMLAENKFNTKADIEIKEDGG